MKIWSNFISALRDFMSACWAVLKLPFQLFGIGWSRFFSLGVRKILLLFFAALVVTVVVLTAFVKITSQPQFCVSCHNMQPYYDAWASSKHSHVTCTKCHMEPGFEGTVRAKFVAISMVANYMTGLYKRTKPWAEISDASCLRSGCHDTRLLNGKVEFKGVTFDHQPHLTKPRRDRQLRCTSCHAQIVQGEHMTVTETTCFLCHLKPDVVTGKQTDLARCTHCHQPPQGAAAADTSFDHTSVLARKVDCLSCHGGYSSGDGFVPIERCNTCHAKQQHIERYKDRDFVHQKHVTEHKVDCLNCHIAIRHGKDVAKTDDPSRQCMTCHGGTDNAIEKVWNGTLPGFPAAPSKMAKLGMSCTSCHMEPIHLDNKKFSAPSCEPCHTEDYNRLWKQWGGPLNSALNALEQKAAAIKDTSGATLLNAIDIYRRGNPVHNPDLLKVLKDRLAGTENTPMTGNCTQCHPAASHIAPEWNTRVVDHARHLAAGVACETCHQTEKPNHGKLKLTINQCDACHHQQALTNPNSCTTCHTFQKAVFHGDEKLAGQALPATMEEADVKCADCHTVKDKVIQRADASACIGCHDASYADTLKTWQLRGDNLLTTIAVRMRSLDKSSKLYREYAKIAEALRRDGSKTVHNGELFKEWAKRAEAVN